jgi:hypothetical protein
MEVSLWTELLKQSPYLLILAAFAWGIWRTVVWVGINAVKPIVDSHQTYLSTQAVAMEKIATASESNAATGEQHAKILQELKLANESKLKILGTIQESENKIVGKLGEVHGDVKNMHGDMQQLVSAVRQNRPVGAVAGVAS